MWLMRVFLLFWLALFVFCAWMFVEATHIRPRDPISAIWLASGSLLLVSLAYDLTLLATYLTNLVVPLRRRRHRVARTLDEVQLAQLAASPPATAVLIPAWRELQTREDRIKFARRLVGVLQSTPTWTTVWILFDSPEDERRHERGVVRRVRRHLRRRGLGFQADRLNFAEYRDKPPELQNKPYSFWLWLHAHPEIQFVFILDADSSLGPQGDEWTAEATHVIERLVSAMRDDSKIAFIQGMLHINDYHTLWGWFQFEGSRFGATYNAPLMELIFAHQSPCYGHGVLWNARTLLEVCDLTYLSHDHIESAAAATLGYKCYFSTRVVTHESAEDSFYNHCGRSLRWGRGNIQWTFPLVCNWWRLPVGPRVYLSLGLMMYALPLAALLFLISSSVLINQDEPMIHSINSPSTATLLLLTLVGLGGHKLVFGKSYLRTLAWAATGIVMAPCQMVVESAIFLSSPFKSKWIARGTRTARVSASDMLNLFKLCVPVSSIGLLMLGLLVGLKPRDYGELLCFVLSFLLLISPLTAVAVSFPLGRLISPRAAEADRRAADAVRPR